MALSWADRARILATLITHLAVEPTDMRHLRRWLRERDPATAPRDVPWWPYRLPPRLEALSLRGARVFEWGSGASTSWLVSRGASVVSVEHDAEWAAKTADAVPSAEVLTVPPTTSGTVTSEVEPGFYFDAYVHAIGSRGDFDLVVVDGRARAACLMAALDHIAPGGTLLLDDSHRRRYRDAICGVPWPRTRVRGLKPGDVISETSLWRRSS